MSKRMFDEHFMLQSAVLGGLKTNTRRWENGLAFLPVKNNEDEYFVTHWEGDCFLVRKYNMGALIEQAYAKPKFQIGQVVAIARRYEELGYTGMVIENGIPVQVEKSKGYRNKLFVCSELMKDYIEITDIRLQHLQDITDEDALKEGVRKFGEADHLEGCQYYVPGLKRTRSNCHMLFATPREAFAALIDKLNGRGTWKSDPWVFAYTFQRHY